MTAAIRTATMSMGSIVASPPSRTYTESARRHKGSVKTRLCSTRARLAPRRALVTSVTNAGPSADLMHPALGCVGLARQTLDEREEIGHLAVEQPVVAEPANRRLGARDRVER